MGQVPLQWSVAYDLVFTGSNAFEPIIPIYVQVILRYALYLGKETQSVILGFYRDQDLDPLLTL
jgi:hypothetical protein